MVMVYRRPSRKYTDTLWQNRNVSRGFASNHLRHGYVLDVFIIVIIQKNLFNMSGNFVEILPLPLASTLELRREMGRVSNLNLSTN